MRVRNTFAIFIVSGFWHGANWTFIVWGVLHAIYFLPLLLTNNNRNNLDIVAKGNLFPSIKELAFMLLTFSLTVFTWIFFRAETLKHAWLYIQDMFMGLVTKSGYIQTINLIHWKIGYAIPVIIAFFILLEWMGREGQFAIELINNHMNKVGRFVLYILLVYSITAFGSYKEVQFIYFQF